MIRMKTNLPRKLDAYDDTVEEIANEQITPSSFYNESMQG